MSYPIKIGETLGGGTMGYGESKIKWYASDDSWEMCILSDGKKYGRVLFDSAEAMFKVKEALGNTFRITPK